MSAAAIACALGGMPSGAGWHRARCPVHNGQSHSLALKDSAAGLIVKCHADCPKDDVFAELARLGLLSGNPVASYQPQDDAVERQTRLARAREIWQETGRADETYVKSYLWSRLCIADHYAPVIRFHHRLLHLETRIKRPAMVCLVQHVEFGSVGVHATFLQLDNNLLARKAPIEPVRKSFGPIRGGAVRLGTIGEGGTLIVGEGIETTLSVSLVLGHPGWAALSANGVAALVLPPQARRIYLAADNDPNDVGQRKALIAAARWRAEGRKVIVAWPPEPGTDFNDVLLRNGVLELGGADG